jgi:hypothetical protein
MLLLPKLDPDERSNAHLQRLVQKLHPSDRSQFLDKLTTQTLRERFHSYRELLLGAQIRCGGADFRYEQNIDGQTPDWSLTEDGILIEFIDVVTLHQRNEKEREITMSICATSNWQGWSTIPSDHIYRKLTDKAGQYSALARRVQAPYVLAVFGEFLASISVEEIEHVLYKQHEVGWFATVPEVSGVIYFRENFFRYEFTYFPNFRANKSAIWCNRINRWSET